MKPALPICCQQCGTKWPEDAAWPRTCITCNTTTWRNVRTVCTILLTTTNPHTGCENIIVGVRKSTHGNGQPALFAGNMEHDGTFSDPEAWRHEVVREVSEETNGLIHLDVAAIKPFYPYPYAMSPTVPGVMIVFSQAHIPWPDLSTFEPNEEVEAILCVPPHEVYLAFETHRTVVGIHSGWVY